MTDMKPRFFVPRVVDGYEWVTADADKGYDQIHSLDGRPRSADWRPVSVSLLRETENGEPRRPALMPWLNHSVLVVRDGAIERLSPILQAYGELLPLSCTEADLVVFNATRVVQALDESRSEILRFGSGGIMAVPRLVLTEAAEAEEVFKLAEIKSSSLLLSEQLVEQIRQAVELDGTDFAEATEM